MMQCTEDGRGLIGVDYTENCEERLNETVFYDGCNYKDKYIEIRHCDYWDGQGDIVADTTSSTTTSTTTTTTSTTSSTSTTTTTTSTTVGTSLTRLLSTLSTMIDDGGRGHHGHGSHDGHHDGRGHGGHRDVDSSEDEGAGKLQRMHPVLLLAVGGLCVVLLALCCCVSCKYLKQKKQLAAFAAIVEDGHREGERTTVEMKAADNKVVAKETTATVLLDEGDAITIR